MLQRTMWLVVAGLAVGVVGGEAQPTRPGSGCGGAACPQGPGMGQDRMAMMLPRVAAYGPAALLDRSEELGLDAAQRDALVLLRDDVRPVVEEAMTTHQRHRQQLMVALGDSLPDPEVVQRHMAAAHAAMGVAHLREARAALRAMRVLTPAQRTVVEAGLPSRGRRGGA